MHSAVSSIDIHRNDVGGEAGVGEAAANSYLLILARDVDGLGLELSGAPTTMPVKLPKASKQGANMGDEGSEGSGSGKQQGAKMEDRAVSQIIMSNFFIIN